MDCNSNNIRPHVQFYCYICMAETRGGVHPEEMYSTSYPLPLSGSFEDDTKAFDRLKCLLWKRLTDESFEENWNIIGRQYIDSECRNFSSLIVSRSKCPMMDDRYICLVIWVIKSQRKIIDTLGSFEGRSNVTNLCVFSETAQFLKALISNP